mgnify:CR=1 FL=1
MVGGCTSAFQFIVVLICMQDATTAAAAASGTGTPDNTIKRRQRMLHVFEPEDSINGSGNGSGAVHLQDLYVDPNAGSTSPAVHHARRISHQSPGSADVYMGSTSPPMATRLPQRLYVEMTPQARPRLQPDAVLLSEPSPFVSHKAARGGDRSIFSLASLASSGDITSVQSGHAPVVNASRDHASSELVLDAAGLSALQSSAKGPTVTLVSSDVHQHSDVASTDMNATLGGAPNRTHDARLPSVGAPVSAAADANIEVSGPLSSTDLTHTGPTAGIPAAVA